jgi:uncharacterized protein YwqG
VAFDAALCQAILDEWRASTAIPCVELTLTPGGTGPLESKLGGSPWLPPGVAWPRSASPLSGPVPLRLLAQLNLAELPRLPGFPERGLLQMFVEGDDLYGADFDEPLRQERFRVLHHADVPSDAAGLGAAARPDEPDEDGTLPPLDPEYRVTGELATQATHAQDFRFEEAFLPLFAARLGLPGPLENLFDKRLDKQWAEAVYRGDLSPTGHRMGGYPMFIQGDPREDGPGLRGHTATLLQIDADCDIMWGDSGVGNFLIEPDRLAAADFANVLYTWDCG